MGKDKVAYYYDSEVGRAYYGPNHPMKPTRIVMAHNLVMGYRLHEKMEIYRPRLSYPMEMAQFHSEDYIDFLSRVTPENEHEYMDQLQRYNLSEECPVFESLFKFCQIYTGGSIDGAVKLNHGHADICINWAGGLHHAKKTEASGFCYINDLVLAILELLKHHARVVYIDIDIHHGDGVEEAFYLTDRVMTVSFHKYGDMFFPGTGDLKDIGERNGKYYSVNVPLKDGIHDGDFVSLFKKVMGKVMEMYQPGAIVLQCGADSLSHDRLGSFNLSLDAHAECVRYMKRFKVPLLVTGGGGYTKNNVARCWANETAAILDTKISNNLPDNDYYEYFAPDYTLKPHQFHFIENQNSKNYLNMIKQQVVENLNSLAHAPSVQMHEAPPDALIPEFEDDDQNPDERFSMYDKDREVKRDDEFYENEKDQDH